MVEIAKPKRKTGPRKVDWVSLYDGWTRGRSAESLAEEYGLVLKTVTTRCGWLDQNFPPGAPGRLIASFTRTLDAAYALLESGQPIEAERYAKAIQALLRAARAMEEWSMDRRKPVAQTATEKDAEVQIEDDPRAELERRLNRIFDFELKKRVDSGDIRLEGPEEKYV